jgi:nitrogen-specific signal transduction histidine kinase
MKKLWIRWSFDNIVPEDRKMVEENMRKRLLGEQTDSEYEFRMTRKDGQIITVRLMAGSIVYKGKPAIPGTVIDITKEKTLESQLIQSQKMEAIGTLANGIAHDFKNILEGIIGFAKLIQKDAIPTVHKYRRIELY